MKILLAMLAALPCFANATVIKCKSVDEKYKVEFRVEPIQQTNREILHPLPFVVTGKMDDGNNEVANVGVRCPEVQKKNRFTHRCNFDFKSVNEDLGAEAYVDAVNGTNRGSIIVFIDGKVSSQQMDCN